MVEAIQLSPQVQQLIMQLQTFQQQVQALALQKESFSIQKFEIERALEELKNLKKNEDVFKAVGPILIKSSVTEQTNELSEKKEMLEVRLKTLEKQEEKLHEKLKEGQKKLQELLSEKEKSAAQ